MATEIGRLVARFEGSTTHFDQAARRVEAAMKQQAREIERVQRQSAASTESLQRQRSAALISIERQQTSAVQSLQRQRSASLIVSEHQSNAAAQSLQRQRSAAIIAGWRAEEREAKRAEAEKTRAVQMAVRAQARTQEQQHRTAQALIRAQERDFKRAEGEKTRAAQAAARAQMRAQEQAHGRMSALFSTLRTTAAGAFAGLIAVASGLGVAISRAMSMDALVRGLTAIAGSTEKAQQQLIRLREVAKAPGLGFREAIQGSIRLQAVGFSAETAERALKVFGNAVALTGGGKSELDRITVQLGQLSAKGKILTQDLRPIIEAAPAVGRALKEAFGTVNAEDIAALGLSADEFVNRLVAQLERLPQVTNNSKNAWENFTDTLDVALVTLGKPFLEPLTRALDAISPQLQRVADATGALFQRIGEDAVKLWANLPEATRAAFTDVVATVQKQGQTVVNWFRENYPLIQAAVTNVLNGIAEKWKTHGGELKQIAEKQLKSILEVTQLALQILAGDWTSAWKSLGTLLKNEGARLAHIAATVLGLVLDALVTTTKSVYKLGVELGEALVDGIAQGIGRKKDALIGDIKIFGLRTALELKKIWAIQSPSKVFYQIGQDAIEGLRLGLESGRKAIQQTLTDITDLTRLKFTTRERKVGTQPQEEAARKIQEALARQGDVLRDLAGGESALEAINRLLADPQVAAMLDERTKALLRFNAALEDNLKKSRERLATVPPVTTRPRTVGETFAGRSVPLGEGSFFFEGGRGETRPRRVFGPSEEDLARLHEGVRGLADRITGDLNRAIYDGLHGGLNRGLQSVGLSVLDFVQNIFLTRLRNALEGALGNLGAGGSGGGLGGFFQSLLGSLLGIGRGPKTKDLGGGSTYTPGGTGATRPRQVFTPAPPDAQRRVVDAVSRGSDEVVNASGALGQTMTQQMRANAEFIVQGLTPGGQGFWAGLAQAAISGAVSGLASRLTAGHKEKEPVPRAMGGSIWPGNIYQVHKDELILPTVAGHVYNQQQMQNFSKPVVNNYYTIMLPPSPKGSYSSPKSRRDLADSLVAALQGSRT